MDTEKATYFIMSLIVLSVFVAAIVQAVQGDWLPAIFLILVWSGLKSQRVRDA